MKLSHCIITRILLLIFSLSISDVAYALSYPAEQPSIEKNVASKKQKSRELEPIREQLSDLFFKTEQILEKLGQQISAKHGIKVDNIEALSMQLLEIRKIIIVARKDIIHLTPLSAKILFSYQNLVEKITHYLSDAIKKEFKSLPSFDHTPKSKSKDQSVDIDVDVCIDSIEGDQKEASIDELMQKNTILQRAVESLSSEASSIGLTLFNRSCRFATNKWEKYKIGNKLWSTSILTATGFLIWFHSSNKNKYLRKFFGYTREHQIKEIANYQATTEMMPKDRFSMEQFLSEDMPIGPLGNISDMAREYNFGKYPLISLLSPLYIPTLNTIKNSLFEIAKKGQGTLFRNLLGGIYTNSKPNLAHFEFTSDTRWNSVVGCSHAKSEFQKLLKFLENPEEHIRRNITPEKGWLLTGPTRTGKSYFARALCGEIEHRLNGTGKTQRVRFFNVPASAIVGAGVELILDFVKEYAPCVIFIDEIHLLNLQKAGDSVRLSEFLVALSGTVEDDPQKMVIFIAATNNPENMDNALRQNGRFGRTIPFELPNFKERKEYLTIKLLNLAVDISQINIDKLSLETDGATFEQIGEMVKEAQIKASNESTLLSHELLEYTLDTVIRKIIPFDEKILTVEEKEIIATQLIGTAFAHILLKSHDIVSRVTIRPYISPTREEMVHEQYNRPDAWKQKDISYGKIFTFRPEDTLHIDTLESLITQCKVNLAGDVAEKVLRGSCGYSYNLDNRYHALNTALHIASNGLYSNSFLSEEKKNEMRDAAYNMLQQYEKELIKLFEQKKKHLKLLVDVLMEYKDLDGGTIEQIVQLSEKELSNQLKEMQKKVNEFIEKQKSHEAIQHQTESVPIGAV